MTRRDFVAAAASAAVAGAEMKRPALCIFSKHLAKLDYEQLGKTSRDLGFDGVDLTVRPKGHVLPERAAEDMPRAVEAIRSHGLAVPMITTELLSDRDPAARPTLSTAARLKIPFFKLGYYHYGKDGVEADVARVKRDVAGLTALAREYAIAAGFHNHSGNYVGAPVWDIRDIIRDLDPKWIGYYLDPAHATIEGGLGGWEISVRMVLPSLKMLAVKDFYWAKNGNRWRVQWCPMGEGMVNWPAVFSALAAGGFAGPISLHVEYDPADEQAAIAKDLEFLKKQVAAAYKGA